MQLIHILWFIISFSKVLSLPINDTFTSQGWFGFEPSQRNTKGNTYIVNSIDEIVNYDPQLMQNPDNYFYAKDSEEVYYFDSKSNVWLAVEADYNDDGDENDDDIEYQEYEKPLKCLDMSQGYKGTLSSSVDISYSQTFAGSRSISVAAMVIGLGLSKKISASGSATFTTQVSCDVSEGQYTQIYMIYTKGKVPKTKQRKVKLIDGKFRDTKDIEIFKGFDFLVDKIPIIECRTSTIPCYDIK